MKIIGIKLNIKRILKAKNFQIFIYDILLALYEIDIMWRKLLIDIDISVYYFDKIIA